MPRIPRPVFADVPHHITQRGNRRKKVFFHKEDYAAYLAWLAQYCAKHRVHVLAYGLMTNHIHLVAIPESESALEKVFRPLHTRYAQRINRVKQWSGHLWQGRFFSSPLDERYLWTAMRYVERNPVRAGMVRRGEDYRWSSARARLRAHSGSRMAAQLISISDWSRWLAESDQREEITVLRQHVERGLPCGTEDFVRGLELQAGQMLRLTSVGRPKKNEIEPVA